eukprot:43895-Chlamydomonas_euryale.AAC.5
MPVLLLPPSAVQLELSDFGWASTMAPVAASSQARSERGGSIASEHAGWYCYTAKAKACADDKDVLSGACRLAFTSAPGYSESASVAPTRKWNTCCSNKAASPFDRTFKGFCMQRQIQF